MDVDVQSEAMDAGPHSPAPPWPTHLVTRALIAADNEAAYLETASADMLSEICWSVDGARQFAHALRVLALEVRRREDMAWRTLGIHLTRNATVAVDFKTYREARDFYEWLLGDGDAKLSSSADPSEQRHTHND